MLRRAVTQEATAIAATWAPALQRTAEVALRCVRGMRLSFRAHLLQHRHCERSEAIQNPTAERLWIASLRSQ
ncbi:hypothetical protein C7G41_35170 [Bradyrhizobium sp. MOS002]|nr:hypothetical protein C7G41_35170 [Bradyrhizobium sp. MOS002]